MAVGKALFWSTPCIQWSWTRDDGVQVPYSPEISSELEQYYQLGHSSHSILSINYIIDYKRMIQYRVSKANNRSVQRYQIYLPSSPPIMGYWEWDAGHGTFLPYAVKATVDIELAHMSHLPSVDLSTKPSCIPYIVDFRTMTQTRHGYGTRRTIRRIPLTQSLQQLLCDTTAKPGMTASTSGVSSFTTPASSILSLSSKLSTSTSKSPKKSTKPPSKSSSSMRTRSSSPKTTNSTTSATTSKRKTSVSLKSSRKSSSSVVVTDSSQIAKSQITSNSPTSQRKDDLLGPLDKFVKNISSLNFGEDSPCPICMTSLSEMSGFEEDAGLLSMSSSSTPPVIDVCKLRKCGHMLHKACLIMYMKNSSDAKGCLRCPTCKVIHGIKTGDMPNGGTMTISKNPYTLPGHEGYGTIEIVYNFKAGIHNGVPFKVHGFPRNCYLPDSPEGNKVLKLLQVAWERRLTFTVGTSVTTGVTNTVVWNEIHHKTEATTNYSGHGYPDDNYLTNVLAELAAQGVEEEDTICDNDDNTYSSDSDL